MNSELLNKEIQEFINSNLNKNATSILLRKNKFVNVSLSEIAEQLDAKQRCKKKLPTWFSTANIYFPNKLNIEQASSELTASYKSQCISGSSIIDLTGGFGVDTYFFAKHFETVVHCEMDKALSEIAEHNFNIFKIDNIAFHNIDGLNLLRSSNEQFDWLYIDPSRRHDDKGKVFFLSDCLPNVPQVLDLLMEHTNNILVKASPMLDIKHALNELKEVEEVHVIAVKNEVKELLFMIKKGYKGEVLIETINMEQVNNQDFSFRLSEEQLATSTLGEIQNYLFEPNAAIMKSGAFKLISEKLKIPKLHQHSHLYTSKELIDFPGRKFEVIKVLPFNKKVLKKEIHHMKCNISTRNFPEKVSYLKKKFQLKDGGSDYLFFTTNLHNEKVVIITRKA